jgi:NAD-dependent dihydropyrimidine dehydrogenase PreA subunit
MYSIVLDQTKCKICGECVDICSNGIYSKEDDRIVIGNTAQCTGCQNCVSVCVNEALSVTEV